MTACVAVSGQAPWVDWTALGQGIILGRFVRHIAAAIGCPQQAKRRTDKVECWPLFKGHGRILCVYRKSSERPDGALASRPSSSRYMRSPGTGRSYIPTLTIS